MKAKFLLLLISFTLCKATFDMNKHELQLVSDHITALECRKLMEALKEKTFYLSHNATGHGIENKPCIELLLEWDRGPGAEKSFLDIAIRLREIGRPDVADKLSRTVYHEKAEAVKKAFLGDPFKNMIHDNSPLLEETAYVGNTGMPETPANVWRWYHTVGVLLCVICLFGFVGLICVMCRDVCCGCDCCKTLSKSMVGLPADVKLASDDKGDYQAIV